MNRYLQTAFVFGAFFILCLVVVLSIMKKFLTVGGVIGIISFLIVITISVYIGWNSSVDTDTTDTTDTTDVSNTRDTRDTTYTSTGSDGYSQKRQRDNWDFHSTFSQIKRDSPEYVLDRNLPSAGSFKYGSDNYIDENENRDEDVDENEIPLPEWMDEKLTPNHVDVSERKFQLFNDPTKNIVERNREQNIQKYLGPVVKALEEREHLIQTAKDHVPPTNEQLEKKRKRIRDQGMVTLNH